MLGAIGNEQGQGTKRLVKALSIAESLNHWIGRILSFSFYVLMVIMVFEVIARYVFNAPTNWVYELSTFVFSGACLLGGGYLLLHKKHINIDILYSHLSSRGRAIIDLCTAPLFFLFVGVLMWQGIDMFWTSLSRWENSPSVWAPALWPVKFLIPVGCGLMLLQLLVNFVKNIMIVRYYYKEITIAKRYYY